MSIHVTTLNALGVFQLTCNECEYLSCGAESAHQFKWCQGNRHFGFVIVIGIVSRIHLMEFLSFRL